VRLRYDIRDAMDLFVWPRCAGCVVVSITLISDSPANIIEAFMYWEYSGARGCEGQ
jgi:hypothetical protein